MLGALMVFSGSAMFGFAGGKGSNKIQEGEVSEDKKKE